MRHEAKSFTERMTTFLALFNALDISMDAGGPDPDVKAAFQSIQLHQDKDEVVLTASVPFNFFKKILSEPPVDFGPEKPKPPEASAPAASPKQKKK